MLPETSRRFQIQFFLHDLHWIARPYDSLFRCVVQRKESCYIRRPRKIEKPGWSAVVLHESQPFKIVLLVGHVIEEMNGLSFKDSENPLFLVAPRAVIDAERHEVPRQRAVERSRSVPLAAKRPVLIRRIADDREIF